MTRLTPLDAGFLKVEDSDPHVSLAIGGVAILAGPMPDPDTLLSTLEQRMTVCPRFRQRLRRYPLDVAAPEWVDDPDFDLTRHVRRIALPRPGTERDLYEVIADIMSWRLDRNHPLWEIWAIEGLSDNRWAVLMKVHHCVADGIATVHMLAGLSDGGPGETFADQLRTGTARRTEQANPDRPALRLPLTPLSVVRAGLRVGRGVRDLAAGLLRSAPSPLNGPVSDLRRYSAARVRLDDVRRVCRAFDVTINDVALAALTESYRTLLLQRGVQPLSDALRTLVPVSVRPPDASGAADNRVSLMLPCLPVDVGDPVQRLLAVHDRMSRSKSSGQHEAGHAVTSIADLIPFALTAQAVRFLVRLPQRGVVSVATNVPGPKRPLQVLGRPVLAVLPVPPIAMQLRIGVAILSYADQLSFGILADFDTVPDIDDFARGIETAVRRLVRCSRRSRTRPRNGLTLVASN